MKNYKYLVIAAAATVFAACSDNENGVNDLTPIRLSSSLTVLETRAGSTEAGRMRMPRATMAAIICIRLMSVPY